MATGDIGNNIRKLQREIKLIKYAGDVDLKGLTQGVPAAFLPLYHYVFTSYSHAVAEEISALDAELFGKSDLRFIEAVYKILRDMFQYKPPITKDQFFSSGFAERKVIMCTRILELIRERNKKHQGGQSGNKSRNTSQPAVPAKVLSQSRTTDPKSSLEKFVAQKSISQPANSARKLGRLSTGRQRPNTAPCNTVPSKQGKTAQVVNELRATQIAELKQSSTSGTSALQSRLVMAPDITLDAANTWIPTPSISRVCPSVVEVVNIPRTASPAEDGSFIETVEINAATPTKHTTMNDQEISDLRLQMTKMEKVLAGFATGFANLENTVDSVASSSKFSEIHPSITDAIAKLQQHMETLMARLVLLENRMTLVESKLGDVPSNPAVSSRLSSLKGTNDITEAPKTKEDEVLSPEIELINGMSKQPQVPFMNDLLPIVSPIKQVAGPSTNIPGGEFLSTNIPDEEFADGESETRRSSTPTSFPVLKFEKGESSFSCQFEDDSTKEQVDRIKNILKDTQDMLKQHDLSG